MKNNLTIIFIFISTMAFGQSNGSITGSIFDLHRNELPGITITLTPLDRTTFSDENGIFAFEAVPPGNYTLTVTGIGFNARKENIQVRESKITEINLQLDQANNVLQEIIVRAPLVNDRYTTGVTTLGTKMPVRLIDIPQSVKVIGQGLITDQQAIDVRDVYKYVSGINTPTPEGTPIVRGLFPNRYVNGARNNFIVDEMSQSLVNVERVEFLKGTSSILYGFANPGGVINVVTKKPLSKPRYAASLSGGSFGRFRGEADLTGPLSANGKVLYRLSVGYQSSPDYRPFIFNKNTTIAPAFTFKLSDKTTIDVQLMYNFVNKSTWYDWGLPPVDGNPDVVQMTYSAHEPTDFVKWNNLALQAEIEHRISENLVFHSRAFLAGSSNYGEIHTPRTAPTAAGDVSRQFRIIDYNRSSQFMTNYISWKFTTGILKHMLLGGVDLFNGYSGSNTQGAAESAAGVPDINIFEPKYGQVPISHYTLTGGGYENSTRQFAGAYIQDQVEILPFLKVILAARYDLYSFKRYPTYAKIENKPFIPSASIVVNPLKKTSVYAMISRGFEPQHNQDPLVGGPFDPQITEQWEAGIKNESFGGYLVTSVAVYNIKRTNALVADPNNPPMLLQIGETTSKGFEFDMAGNIGKGISIIANYSYNDVKITRTTQANPGSRPTSQPFHLAAGFLKYTVLSGAMKGLGIGAGASYAGKGTHASLQVPEYTTMDAALYYAAGNLNFGFNLYNVSDKRYYLSTGSAQQVYPGLPRNWLFRVGMVL